MEVGTLPSELSLLVDVENKDYFLLSIRKFLFNLVLSFSRIHTHI